ncbi:MAG: DUF3883 domain-containing protein, partial [Candidatus Omnitrophica bacterium]|nr:DUF3883 domain-containing protein [Candidatus Omnitrophota bacterium]
IGDQLEPKFGKLGREYANVVFDKEYLKKNPTLEWVTPGHPLFEAVREDVLSQVSNDLSHGSVFYDLHSKEPYRLDVFSASICDGMRKEIHKRLFVVQTDLVGGISVRQPTIFLDLAIGDNKASLPDDSKLPSKDQLEVALVEKSLKPFLQEICNEREKEVAIITRHVTISLDELIHKQNMRLAELINQQQSGDKASHLPGLISQAETHVDELNNRKERRLNDLKMERNCMIDKIEHLGRAWVLPHPERMSPSVAFMVRDDEIEKIAVDAVRKYEEEQGWVVESVEKDNRGFDLISRKPHPHDDKTFIEVKFIEVKGRATIGEIAVTSNEYKTAERLQKDYWLYVVYNCASKPEIHRIQDPVRLGWEALVKVEHYHVGAEKILGAEKKS